VVFFFIKWVDSTSRAVQFQKRMMPSGPSASDIQRWTNISREGMHEVNREELNRILGKMKTSGAESLTPTEVVFLNRFSNR
jgi:hypothetical protein